MTTPTNLFADLPRLVLDALFTTLREAAKVRIELKLAPCGRTVLVDLVPDSPPMRTGHDGQRIGDERLGLTSAVLPAWAVSWALTTPRPLCLLAGYLVAGHNVPA